MSTPRFTWRDPRFSYADALTGSRLVMLPYLIYGLVAKLPGLAVTTILAMIVTDLIDGRVARRLGHARPSGAALDSTVDFVVIYGLFTTFLAIGLLPWWKWLVIFLPAVLLAWTQVLYLLRAPEVEFALTPAGKRVGQIQYAYLPFLLARTYWWHERWAQVVDHVIFALLAVAIIFSTIGTLKTLRRLLRSP